jgi:predicted DNA-binding transcriptional regulator YafY
VLAERNWLNGWKWTCAQRYIVRLKDLSIPIDSSPGVGGAYRLRPGFRLPPLLLTNEEAFALSLGLRALRQIGLAAFAPATEGALAKLGRVLPEALRESIRSVEEVVAIEPGPWVVPTSVEYLIQAASAIRSSRRIRLCTNPTTRRSPTARSNPTAWCTPTVAGTSLAIACRGRRRVLFAWTG